MALDAGTAFVDIQPKVGAGFFSGITSKLSGGGALGALGPVGLAAGAALGAGIIAGVAVFKLGETFDEVKDIIITATGASGDALVGLQDDFKEVFKEVPGDAADVAVAIAEVNTRLGLTGEPLQDIATRMHEIARLAEQDVGGTVEDVTRVFGDWGVATEDQALTMDKLFKITQDTGIGLDTLTGTIVSFGAPLRQLGFSLDEAAVLTGKWNKEGVNTEAIMGGLKIGLGKLSAETDDVPGAFQDIIEAIAGAGTAGEANQIAMETFGLRAGPDLAAAVREGRFEIGEMVEALGGAGGALDDSIDRTESFSEKWKKLVNKTMVALEPIATALFDGIAAGMDFLLPLIEPLVAGLAALTSIITTALGPAFEFISGLFASITDGFSGTGEGAGEFGLLIQEVWASVQELFTAAQIVVEEVLAAITELWDLHGEQILQIVDLVWGNIKTQIEAFIRIIRGVIQVVTGLISGDWDKVWEGISNVFGGVWDGIVSAVTTAIDIMKDLIGGMLDFVPGIWDTAWEGMRDGFETIWNGMVGTLRTIGNALLGLLERLVNSALRGLQRAIDAADVLAGPFINFPDNALPRISIPRLAEGGQITAGGLVQVHRDELLALPGGASVIPLDRMDGGRPYSIKLILDGRTIAKASGPHLADELVLHSGARRNG